ncbi:Hypothetical protein D9617_8g051510 [Elsinoe fawcettii]|nr:Hypothetical protein D9617_8g051510 [Elsinoe fawcettii]
MANLTKPTAAGVPYYWSTEVAGTTFLEWALTAPAGGVPAPPVTLDFWGDQGYCQLNLAPNWAVWEKNPSLPAQGTVVVTLDQNNKTLGSTRSCDFNTATTSWAREYLNADCNWEGKYRGPGFNNWRTITQDDSLSSVFGLGIYIGAVWQYGSTHVLFGSTLEPNIFYTDPITLTSSIMAPTMPALGKYIPVLSALVDKCSTVTFGDMPQTLYAANFLTSYVRAEREGGLTQPPPAATMPAIRPPITPHEPVITAPAIPTPIPQPTAEVTSATKPANTRAESANQPTNVSPNNPGVPNQNTPNVPVVVGNIEPNNQPQQGGLQPGSSPDTPSQPNLLISGTRILPGAAPTIIAGHEIFIPSTSSPNKAKGGAVNPSPAAEGVVVIDSTTIPLSSLNQHLSTALPDLQKAGLSVSSPSAPAALPALVVGTRTLLPGAPAVIVNGRTISIAPAQSTESAASGTKGTRVVVDGKTMSLAEATALPELRDAGIRATSVPSSAANGGVAEWIMKALGSSSSSSSSSGSSGGNANSESGTDGTAASGSGRTSQNAGTGRNGTVPFTGDAAVSRPVLLMMAVPALLGVLISSAQGL